MKLSLFSRSSAGVSLLLALLWSVAPASASTKEAPAKRSKALPPALQRVHDVPIPQSVFNIPSQPSEGRNPFFPESIIKIAPPRINPANPTDLSSSLVLNGITSPPKPTAMINGRTFEQGEQGEVKLPAGGRMLIKVEEIKTESAIIVVGGQRRELRLRAGV